MWGGYGEASDSRRYWALLRYLLPESQGGSPHSNAPPRA